MKVKDIIISNLVRFTGCNKNAFNEKFPRIVVRESFEGKKRVLHPFSNQRQLLRKKALNFLVRE